MSDPEVRHSNDGFIVDTEPPRCPFCGERSLADGSCSARCIQSRRIDDRALDREVRQG